MISGQDEPDIEKVATEINGYNIADGRVLGTFADLKDDGSTACGMDLRWLLLHRPQ